MPVYKVIIEGGHTFKATGNHKMIMHDGSRKQVQDLLPSDKLQIAKRVERTLIELNKNVSTHNKNHYIVLENNVHSKAEHKMIWEFANGTVPKRHVIHHVDFNSKNNNIENLLCIEFNAHKELHAKNMLCKNNQSAKIETDQVRFAKLSVSTSSLNNPLAADVTNKEIFEHIEILTKQLRCSVNVNDCAPYAKGHVLPHYLNDFKLNENNFSDVAKECQISDELINIDTRMLKRALEAKTASYSWKCINNELHVERTCEWCSEKFWEEYTKREVSFCGHSCSNFYANRKADKNIAREASLQKMRQERAAITRLGQLNTFTKLLFDLGHDPSFDEWVNECKINGIPFSLGTKNGFVIWQQLKSESEAVLHNHRVVSVEFAGNEDVYNGTVDDVHNFYIGGWNTENNESLLLLTQNCGEIVLSPYDSCRLLLLNLSKFVKNPYETGATFDYVAFARAAKVAQRLMDDLVDLELEAVDTIIKKIESDQESEAVKHAELALWRKIKDAASNGRRTGLGITAMGDALAALNIRYGSQESVDKTEEIYNVLEVNAYRSSVCMAAERGAFPIFSHKLEAEHEFIQKVISADPVLRSDYLKHGRRNIAITTTAPAGSVSCLTQTTSGIEPAFLVSYTRRKKVNPNDINSRVDFVDQLGDKWQEYKVYHNGYKKWMEVTGKGDNIEASPYWKATSNDVNWEMSVKLQAAAQKWVCHSLSKTCNLPSETTRETVAQVYMSAWESGCKGFTVYRDGCRTGVLVADVPSVEENKSDSQPAVIAENHAPKRLRELPCDIHRINVKGSAGTESYLVLVGMMDNKPYEVFCGLSSQVEVPKKSKRGILVKNGKKEGVATYNLSIPVGDDDAVVFKNVVELFANPLHGAFTRSLSLALRHGIPVQYVTEQLQKDRHSDMQSFSKVISRVLKGYIPDGTKSTSDKKCPSCGAVDGLIYQEGCLTCKSCGYSKCS